MNTNIKWEIRIFLYLISSTLPPVIKSIFSSFTCFSFLHIYSYRSVFDTSACMYLHIHTNICVLLNYCNLMLQSDDDDPAEESSLVMETEKSTKAAPGCSTSDPSTSSQVGCERRAGLQENLQENGQNNEAEENVQETQTTQHRGGIQAATSTAVPAASKAHLFIFDRESQDVESQSIFADRPAALARRPETTTADSAHSLSQIQLEEDKRRIRKLMEETKQVSTQRRSCCSVRTRLHKGWQGLRRGTGRGWAVEW